MLARSPGPPVASERGWRDRDGGTARGGRKTHATPRTPLTRPPSCGCLRAAGACSSSIRTGGQRRPTAGGVRSGPRARRLDQSREITGGEAAPGRARQTGGGSSGQGRGGVSHVGRRGRLSCRAPPPHLTIHAPTSRHVPTLRGPRHASRELPGRWLATTVWVAREVPPHSPCRSVPGVA